MQNSSSRSTLSPAKAWSRHAARAVALAGLLGVCLAAAAQRLPADPLTGDTWHAVGQTWPGTLKFDSSAKKVELKPIGASPLLATYTYTVKSPAPMTSGKGAKPAVEGTLQMTSLQGQVSAATFRIENNKELVLTFNGGQRPETYRRMSPAEEAAEISRIEKMLKSGQLGQVRPPVTVQTP